MALTDGTAERTFISMRGAEARGDESTFQNVEPADGDVVHISGYTFAHHTGEGLRAFMRRTAPNRRFLALFDPSPVVADIDDETFGEMVEYRPVWSCNEREAVLIAGRLGLPMHQGTFRTLIERIEHPQSARPVYRKLPLILAGNKAFRWMNPCVPSTNLWISWNRIRGF